MTIVVLTASYLLSVAGAVNSDMCHTIVTALGDGAPEGSAVS
jgi:hypothetical protein